MGIQSPCHDAVNRIINGWVYDILLDDSDSWTDIIMDCEDVNPDNVHSVMDTHHPLGFIAHGHGGWAGMSGHGNVIIWALYLDHDQYLPLLKDKIVYLISCYTGVQLGPALVNDYGAKVYFGFDDTCYVGSGWHSKLTLLEPWFALMEGDTVQQAYDRTIDKYNYYIDAGFTTLIHNRDHFIMIGDPNATLFPIDDNMVTDDLNFSIEVS